MDHHLSNFILPQPYSEEEESKSISSISSANSLTYFLLKCSKFTSKSISPIIYLILLSSSIRTLSRLCLILLSPPSPPSPLYPLYPPSPPSPLYPPSPLSPDQQMTSSPINPNPAHRTIELMQPTNLKTKAALLPNLQIKLSNLPSRQRRKREARRKPSMRTVSSTRLRQHSCLYWHLQSRRPRGQREMLEQLGLKGLMQSSTWMTLEPQGNMLGLDSGSGKGRSGQSLCHSALQGLFIFLFFRTVKKDQNDMSLLLIYNTISHIKWFSHN